MCGSIAHSNASVSEIDVVSDDFRSIIARLFPVQYKAHGGRVQVGTEGLLLQDTQRGHRVRGRGRCLAMDKLTIRPCTCWIKGLEQKSVAKSHDTISTCQHFHIANVNFVCVCLCTLICVHAFA